MDKKKFVQSLSNVKLVIGNGYDLYCGLKSKYSDYFSRYVDKNDTFIKWINSFKMKAKEYLNFYLEKGIELINNWVEFEHFSRTNIWDFFFYLVSIVNADKEKSIWLWCDIEDVMYNSLFETKKKCMINIGIEWQSIYDMITKAKGIDKCNIEECILASVILKRKGFKDFDSKEDYYCYLLDELKCFEKEFGGFIMEQHEIHYGLPNLSEIKFRSNSKLLVNELCNYDNIVSVDSFNFDDLGIDSYNKPFHNINGDVNSPIFGVDSNCVNAEDIRFIFTKTNRRMELDMERVEKTNFTDFKNVVVFGHSLSQNDYNYFFPLLDKLEISDFLSNKKIVFAFSIYDLDKEIEIKRNIRYAIQKLFESYAIYKDINEPNRLLDSLTTQGRVIMYEIPQAKFLETNYFL